MNLFISVRIISNNSKAITSVIIQYNECSMERLIGESGAVKH